MSMEEIEFQKQGLDNGVTPNFLTGSLRGGHCHNQHDMWLSYHPQKTVLYLVEMELWLVLGMCWMHTVFYQVWEARRWRGGDGKVRRGMGGRKESSTKDSCLKVSPCCCAWDWDFRHQWKRYFWTGVILHNFPSAKLLLTCGAVGISPEFLWHIYFSCVSLIKMHQFRSIQSLSCVLLCDPMNCSTPGLPIQHQLLEFT